jgi:hypothetical protein
MHSLLARALRPLADLVLRSVRVDDPWERLRGGAAYHLFGPGSRHDFRWYFEGESTVAVATVDELCEWLLACEYACDPDLFNEADLWQHPGAFERLRRGDCEDYALWAWRKLTELGIEAEFFVGRQRPRQGQPGGAHAWVVCRLDGADYLLEATARSREHMLRRLDDARDAYVPHFSVDQRFRRHVFGGYVQHRREQRRARHVKVRDRDRGSGIADRWSVIDRS